MAQYSKKEFAELVGIGTNVLAIYIKRGKVVINSKELIDDKNEFNAAFIAKALGRKQNKSEPIEVEVEVVHEAKVVKPKKKVDEEETSENSTVAQLDKKKQLLDIKKKEADLEKVNLQNAKLKGEVIPFGLMSPLITQDHQNIVTAFKNAADAIILEMSKKKAFTGQEVADLNASLVSVINTAVNEATNQTIKSLDMIIENYKSTIK